MAEFGVKVCQTLLSAKWVSCNQNSILYGTDEDELIYIILKIKEAKIDITVEDGLNEFLRVNIIHKDYGSIHLFQPYLIYKIIKELRLEHD